MRVLACALVMAAATPAQAFITYDFLSEPIFTGQRFTYWSPDYLAGVTPLAGEGLRFCRPFALTCDGITAARLGDDLLITFSESGANFSAVYAYRFRGAGTGGNGSWLTDAGVPFPAALTISGTPGALPGPPQPEVPEPAIWAQMLAGFGLIGTALRRRIGARQAGRDITTACPSAPASA